MQPSLLPTDLHFFSSLVAAGSLSAAARELRVTTAAVSKRLSLLESRLKVTLVNRTTRRMGLTVEGETFLNHARKIIGDLADLELAMGSAQSQPSGLLRVNATLGFGRSHIAPLVARYVAQFPQVEVRLLLSTDPPLLSEDAFDVCIRFGPPPDARVIARKVAANRRLLCASPDYLKRCGHPRTPADLAAHQFINIRQGEEAYGVLKLASGKSAPLQTIKTRGKLTCNDGGIALQWALDGLGIVQRAEWDVRQHLIAGHLIELLPKYRTPEADIYAIYPPQHQASARVREFVNLMQTTLAHGISAAPL